DLDRAERLRRQPGRDEEDLGRIRARPAEDVDPGEVRAIQRALVLDAEATDPAQAISEAPPADVGGGDQPRHRDRRRRARPGWPVPVVQRLCPAGEARRRVPPAHPILYAGGPLREQPGIAGQFSLLSRGRRLWGGPRPQARQYLYVHLRPDLLR